MGALYHRTPCTCLNPGMGLGAPVYVAAGGVSRRARNNECNEEAYEYEESKLHNNSRVFGNIISCSS